MGKGSRLRRLRSEAALARHATYPWGAAQPLLDLTAEYPSLTQIERTVNDTSELEASRQKHLGRKKPPSQPEARVIAAVGKTGDYPFASSELIEEWMRGWEMPSRSGSPTSGAGRIKTSSSVFVAITDDDDMPSSSAARDRPTVSIPIRYIELCSRIADVFPLFATVTRSGLTWQQVGEARRALFEYTDPNTATPATTEDLIHNTADEIFTTRVTSAAVRWAIAHEMAHLRTTATQRHAAYEKVHQLWPSLQEDEWDSLRGELEPFGGILYKYRDEIACDLLANQFVLDSAFSSDDLLTQACGSLLALEALVWNGWHTDKSARSDTHPSPSLRFMLVYQDWLDVVGELTTWQYRTPPDVLALQDFAYFYAFQRWGVGAYSQHRSGSQWGQDISEILSTLEHVAPGDGPPTIYAKDAGGRIRRVQPHP
ncbi:MULTISPECIES: hypothetical protein [Microbacterium]|jgi:hypothetical protein|uniref:hypothetical protein n=1 Tax=Microbacterium TaxID=33882 RepID=UPI002782A7E8|nr:MULTISPECIES: hypothetical protein [Microbacterium]MDF2920495.1 hypothetical protein [Microbacterium sp.]MDQ1074221.1 hypothetical protein [Microbacterium sp. SORGH_AS_0969]MDQ1114448.1 hypothetical protein [Microbacterium testaceum]